MNSALIGLSVAAVVLAVVLLPMALRRKGVRVPVIVQTSHLKCKSCGVEFDYEWIPASSFTSIRLGRSRYLRCPSCHKWSTFNIVSTRVDPNTHHCELRIGPS